MRKHFESELSYLWFFTKGNFRKRKSFPRARPENPAFPHNRHSIASSRLSNLWWWSSNFKLPWEWKNKASAAKLNNAFTFDDSPHIPGRPNVYTGKGWKQKQKKMFKSKQVSEIHNHVMRIRRVWMDGVGFPKRVNFRREYNLTFHMITMIYDLRFCFSPLVLFISSDYTFATCNFRRSFFYYCWSVSPSLVIVFLWFLPTGRLVAG